MFQLRVAHSAPSAPVLPPPATSPRLHIDRLDAAWEAALHTQPEHFWGFRSLSLGTPPSAAQLARLQERLRVPKPLASITRVSAPQPHTLLEALHLGIRDSDVTAAHLASPFALPPPPAGSAWPRSDVQQLFARHPNLRVASFCRPLIATERVNVAIDRDLAYARRRVPPVLSETARTHVVWQTLCIDIARLLYCVAKDIEQVRAPSLSHVMIVFDVSVVINFEQALWRALRSLCDLHDPDALWLGEMLQRTRPLDAPQASIVWEFAYGTPPSNELGAFRLQGATRQTLSVARVPVQASMPQPFVWSTLCVAPPLPPGSTPSSGGASEMSP